MLKECTRSRQRRRDMGSELLWIQERQPLAVLLCVRELGCGLLRPGSARLNVCLVRLALVVSARRIVRGKARNIILGFESTTGGRFSKMSCGVGQIARR